MVTGITGIHGNPSALVPHSPHNFGPDSGLQRLSLSSASYILDSWEHRSLGFQSTPWVALPCLKLSCHSLSCLGQWFQRLLVG